MIWPLTLETKTTEYVKPVLFYLPRANDFLSLSLVSQLLVKVSISGPKRLSHFTYHLSIVSSNVSYQTALHSRCVSRTRTPPHCIYTNIHIRFVTRVGSRLSYSAVSWASK
jgi:hypothetical protein